MPQLDAVTDAERQSVAAQAAALLLQLQGPQIGGPGAPLVLGDTITEEMLTPQWVDADAETPLLATGQALSIVESKPPAHPGAASQPADVVGYVRHVRESSREGGAAEVTAASGSGIAALIRDALDWVDANVPGSPIVRVVTAPAYQLTLLGLYNGDSLTGFVVVTPAPRDLDVENHKLYSPSELRGLLRGIGSITGIQP